MRRHGWPLLLPWLVAALLALTCHNRDTLPAPPMIDGMPECEAR